VVIFVPVHLSLQVQIHKFSTYEYVPIYFRATGSSHGPGDDVDQSARTGILAEIVIAAVVISIVTVITALW
jgi:hypothetical protein